MRLILFFLFIVSLVGSFAFAIEIRLLEADTLELRPITLPDGSEGELTVISGSPVRLRIDEDEITAEYIEFDRQSRLLRIVGAGDLSYGDIATEGRDYVVDLTTEEFTVQDVFIFTAPIDIQGVSAERLPGQVDITAGAFSPCSRCNQARQDYSFRAERLRLYPGDRLIAFDVTVLIRDAPILFLPLLVIPLGPQDRQPRFSISQGTGLVSEDDGAEIALDWPYVIGPNAYGTTLLRYYADVSPGTGNGLTESLFGGGVDKSYFGGGFEHNFFTEQGQGDLDFFYLPSLRERDGEDARNEFTFRFAYSTIENLEIPQLEVLFERDDATNQRIGEYGVIYNTPLFGGSLLGLDAQFFTQGYYDFDRGDDETLPSYADRNTPELTYGQITLEPGDDASFSVGPLTLSDLLLDLGVFEDASSPSNRGAAQTPKSTAGRLLDNYRLSLETLEPWSGFSVSGSTDFSGQYYTTGERLVNWDSELGASQDFGIGSLSATLNRDVNEGESPFRFDALSTSQTRTDLTSSLSFTPLPWFSLDVNETYVFVDTRNPEDLGAGPIESRLELFNNLSWLDIEVANDYDPKENDPGNLETLFELRSPDPVVSGGLRYEQIVDLDLAPNRTDGTLENNSETTVTAELGYTNLFNVDLAGGYEYDNTDDEGDPMSIQGQYKPLEIGATLGSLDQEDDLPGIRLYYERDLNLSEMREVGYELTGRYGPLTTRLEQTFDFQNSRADDTLYNLTWEGIISAEAEGFTLVPPSFVGLENESESDFSVSLRDETRPEDRAWELTYSTTYDPDFDNRLGGTGGYTDSQLTLLTNLPTTYIGVGGGNIGFNIDFSAELFLADAQLERTYLNSGALTLYADFFSRVGLQGNLQYSAGYSDGEITSSTLRIEEFGPTVRLTDDLYVSALINDFWDFTGNSPTRSPYNFQPTLYVVWDRCCWALYGSYDTEDGSISLAVGFPGEEEGFQQSLNTPLALPRRSVGE